MARPRRPSIELPPYVNCVRVKGRPYYYLHFGRGTKYARKPVRLPDDPRDPEFWATYRRLMGESEPRPNPKSFDHVIEVYKASPEYAELAPTTRRDYDHYLKLIATTWGGLEVAGLEPAHVLALRDKRRNTPGATNALIRVLSLLISWSVPRGYRVDNPCQHVRKLSIGDGWQPRPWDTIELVREHGPSWMWQATAVALYTGQRQGDCLSMRWDHVRDGLISVMQEKTGARLAIPLHKDLVTVLAGIPKRAVTILTSTAGTPWTKDGFKSSWATAVTGMPNPRKGYTPKPRETPLVAIREAGLVYHGLRKSAVVFLLEAGCTDAEVSAITGQTRQMIEHYAREVNQRKLAAAAILKWERSEKSR